MSDDVQPSGLRPPRQKRSVKVTGAPAAVVKELIRQEYRHGAIGAGLGFAAIVGGCVLGVSGATGHTAWTAKLLGLSSQISDAAPGVVLFIVGVVVVFITRPKINVGDVR